MPSKDVTEARIQFNVVFLNVFEQLFRSQDFGDTDQLQLINKITKINNYQPDRSYHDHGRKAPYGRSYWPTYIQDSTYPTSSHSIDSLLVVRDPKNNKISKQQNYFNRYLEVTRSYSNIVILSWNVEFSKSPID